MFLAGLPFSAQSTNGAATLERIYSHSFDMSVNGYFMVGNTIQWFVEYKPDNTLTFPRAVFQIRNGAVPLDQRVLIQEITAGGTSETTTRNVISVLAQGEYRGAPAEQLVDNGVVELKPYFRLEPGQSLDVYILTEAAGGTGNHDFRIKGTLIGWATRNFEEYLDFIRKN
jgi:hypothetical protein